MSKAEQRKRLGMYLQGLIDKALDIEAEMESLPRDPRGDTYIDMLRNDFIAHSQKGGFTAMYKDKDGHLYQINVYRRD